ncbi:MAG: hypothetical protein AMXMBFR82_03310 [Candidatus Hydrogenedentota bacterium]
MELIEAKARYQLGILDSDAICALARQWIDQDIVSNSLAELSTVSRPIMSEVGPLFESAMEELGVVSLSRIGTVRLIVRSTLSRMVAGDLDILDGAEFLYRLHLALGEEFPNQEYVGDALGLEFIFSWLREIWDYRDGSPIGHSVDHPSSEIEQTLRQHLLDESNAWLDRFQEPTC